MACPIADGAVEVMECGLSECPCDCSGEWGPWARCTAACGGGQQLRHYVVLEAAAIPVTVMTPEDARLDRIGLNTTCLPLPPLPVAAPAQRTGTSPCSEVTSGTADLAAARRARMIRRSASTAGVYNAPVGL